MKKFISILGSTGSVGLSTLSILDKNKKDFKPFVFSANKNYKIICQQIKKYKPHFFIISDKNTYYKVLKKFKKKKIKILNNFLDLKLKKKSDITITAIPGIAGLEPTIKLVEKAKRY